MVLPPAQLKTKKQKKKEKEKAERGPVLGNFDEKPTIMTSLRPPIRGKKPTKKLSFGEKRVLRKRKREERRALRKQLKKKVKRPTFVMPKPEEVADAELDEEEERHRKTPPINFRINTRTKTLDVRVILHHCPVQHINLDPTTTHFVLDTLKWTKKFQVNMLYPDGVLCDPKGATAKFEHGILYVSLPITELPESAKEKQAKISEAIREGRRRRFVQARGGELVGMRVAPPKERKRKRDPDDAEDAYVPIPRIGPKKKFVTDKSVLAQMAEQAAAEEQSKVAGRQAKMGATEAFFKEKRAMKEEAKGRKASLHERVLDRIVEQQQQVIKERETALGLDVKPVLAAGVDAKTNRSAKKVTFSSSNMVVKFGGEGACTGKKPGKGKRGKETDVIEYTN